MRISRPGAMVSRRTAMLSRRTAILGGSALIAGAGAGLVRAAPAIPRNMCVLTPQAIEGPFWFDPDLNRADIVEDRAGTPMELRVQVVDAGDGCAPIADARVDIWQCDAEGLYSGYARQGFDGRTDARGESFLRGWQAAGADGTASFRTIYPGTYPIRVVHTHVKVFLGERDVLTAQIYFPDEVTASVYRDDPTYATSIPNVRPNARDRLAQLQGDSMIAETWDESGLLTAAVTVGVRA